MGTRSVVAYEHDNGELVGTYVHWDGYPSHMIPGLTKMFEEKGFDGMKEWVDAGIVGAGYSTLDSEPYGDSDEPWKMKIDSQEYGYVITPSGVELAYSLV